MRLLAREPRTLRMQFLHLGLEQLAIDLRDRRGDGVSNEEVEHLVEVRCPVESCPGPEGHRQVCMSFDVDGRLSQTGDDEAILHAERVFGLRWQAGA